MSASVTYKDEILTTVKNTSKDLLTSGKYLEDDITITDITSLQAKSNISPTASSQTVSADAGYDGLSSVQINAIPSDYIGTDIPRRSSISVSQDNNTIHVDDGYYEDDIDTSMGACTVTGASVLIDSQGDATGSIIVGRGGYINSGSHTFYVDDAVTPRSSSDLTVSGATVSVPYGYYSADASKSVASGSAGTPTATKGSVNNHAVNVTPSVTNTTGYITGGTKTGTAVTVSASELDSGTKSITANGNSQDVIGYANVDVNVPNSYSSTDEGKVVSNGTLVSQTSATYTENDTYDTTLIDEVTVNVSGGGGGDQAEVNDVTLIDYDGTVLYSYTKDEFLALTEMPPNPSHTDKGLVAQGWNWTLTQAKAYVADNDYLCIGQYYRTSDGKTHARVEITDLELGNALYVRLVQSVKNGTVIDWGDGDTTVVTVNAYTAYTASHVYDAVGAYDLTIYSVDGTYNLSYWGSNGGIFYTGSAAAAKITAPCVKSLYIGDDCSQLYRNALTWCIQLKEIVIPDNGLKIGENNSNYVFNNSIKLKAIVFPPSSSLLTMGVINNIPNLRFLSFGYNTDFDSEYLNISLTLNVPCLEMLTTPNVTSLGNGVLYGCQNIKRFAVPGTYTTLYGGYFRDCSKIHKLVIPPTVTQINDYAMAGGLFGEIHFKSTTPPTVANARGLPYGTGVVYVPYSSDHSILDAYKTATNWSSLANYMQEEPQ